MAINSFVYCWTDKLKNMLYVGVHKGTTDDGYICSSKLMLEEYNKRPDDFSRQIIASGTWEDMKRFESKILQSADAAKNSDYYNMHNGQGDYIITKHTEAAKQKMRSHVRTKEHCEKISMAKKGKVPKAVYIRDSLNGENNPMYGKKHKESTIAILKAQRSTPEYRAAQSARMKEIRARGKLQ